MTTQTAKFPSLTDAARRLRELLIETEPDQPRTIYRSGGCFFQVSWLTCTSLSVFPCNREGHLPDRALGIIFPMAGGRDVEDEQWLEEMEDKHLRACSTVIRRSRKVVRAEVGKQVTA